MLEGSSHHIFNLKEINKKRISNYDEENFSPVMEKLEEYVSQSNEDQKMFSRQSGIKNEDNYNRTQLKDSVISKILYNLDSKDNKNKTLIIKPKSLFKLKNQVPKPKKSLKVLPNHNLLNIIKNISPNKKKASLNITDDNPDILFNLLSPHKNNSKKSNNLLFKNKRKTIAFSNSKKRISRFSNSYNIINPEEFSNFQSGLALKKKTFKERTNFKVDKTYIQNHETIQTNQKFMNNFTKPKKKQSELSFDNNSDEFRFSSLIKKNKIQLFRGFNLKNSRLNNENKGSVIRSIFKDPNIKKKQSLLYKIKIYAFIQSIASLISILLCIIDIELYNQYSKKYIKEKNIEYDKYYEIENREINSRENVVRILNAIFSFICLIMTFFIFVAKYRFNRKETKKILKKRNRSLNFIYDFHNNKNKYNKINHKAQVIKLIIRCIINIIFYPPNLNYIYYSYSNNILCIYPFNTFILLLSSLKLYNIYRCVFYFIPVTSTLGKTICEKYNVKLNIKFMFRTIYSKHKISFALIIIVIFTILISILLRSIELFSNDLSLLERLYSDTINSNFLIHYEINIYETLWIYLSLLMKNPGWYVNPRTPFGQLLLFIVYIMGTLFLYIIYFRLNYLMQLDRTSFQAYSKLTKLFLPENKENKASEVILSFILLKKYYTKYDTSEMEKRVAENDKENYINKRRKSIFYSEINKMREKNILILKQKKIHFLRVRFAFFLKFFTDINNYVDFYKISRKQPMNMSSVFQNIENKMDDNLESINVRLNSIDSIDNIFERLKKNDNILLKKLKKIKKVDNSIINYLIGLNNYQSRIWTQKKKDLQTEINGVAPLKRSRTKMVFNFKSYKAIRDVLK